MIVENLKYLRESIERSCVEANRKPEDVKLIAVSKNFGLDEINTAFNNGMKNFGENRAQELTAKYNVLGNKVAWHFIGNLQRNKVRFAVQSADIIHSVNSLQLAYEINRLAGKINKVQKVLLQIKTSDEETKSGIEKESEIYDLVNYCKEYSNIELLGFMTIAPFTDDAVLIRDSFRFLRDLKDQYNAKGFENIKELSMGMTDDYKIAIEEGATMLRIGSAIFGKRDYSKEIMRL
ncbi:MAG: YggS family pyridoxal phosphate-dependent enzyme [Ignavibacteriaceae bacterium]|nr:YggS family pyridoxal phosphate-dependent enzyme [Ignavibacteriaceae bacterium]